MTSLIVTAVLFYLGVGALFFDHANTYFSEKDLGEGFRFLPYVIFWAPYLLIIGVAVIIVFFMQCAEEIMKLYGRLK